MRIQSSFLGTFTVATLILASLSAQAEEVSTTGKGVVGGTLLGAEIVVASEAAFKVKPAWAYLAGGLAGGAAGGISGYFIEQDANPKTTMLILGAGMALVIPTTVAVLSATAYEPPSNYTQDRAPVDEPVAEPPQVTDTPGGGPPATSPPPGAVPPVPPAPPVSPPASAPSTNPPSSSRPRHRDGVHAQHRTLPLEYHLSPPALIAVSAEALTLGVPAIEFRDVYSRREIAMYGVAQATELRVPVLSFFF